MAVGGVIGYFKAGSNQSLIAGGGSALVLCYVYLTLPTKPFLASAIGLGQCLSSHLSFYVCQHRCTTEKDLCYVVYQAVWCSSARLTV
jgi:hypothetical protein